MSKSLNHNQRKGRRGGGGVENKKSEEKGRLVYGGEEHRDT